MKREKVGAVIVCAGQSQRMRGIDKSFAELDGKTLMARVIETFQGCKAVDEIVVVLAEGNLERGKQLASNYPKVSSFCTGGRRRQDSVREGLRRLTGCQWMVIHDGARPLIDSELIDRGLEEAKGSGTAATAAVPLKDTIKVASPDGFVIDTPQQDTLWAIQTPQVFRFDLISQAHQEVAEDVSDDAMMLERLGHKVKLYMGAYENIKITTPEDLAVAETILRSEIRGKNPDP